MRNTVHEKHPRYVMRRFTRPPSIPITLPIQDFDCVRMVGAYLDWKLGPERYNEDYELLSEFVKHIKFKEGQDPAAFLKNVFLNYMKAQKDHGCYHHTLKMNNRTEQAFLEEKWLKNVILNLTPELKVLYYRYSTIYSGKNVRYEPAMLRLYLWALLRELNHKEAGFSLVQMDKMLGATSDPFSLVSVIEMIQYLLLLSCELFLKTRIFHATIPGEIASAFYMFVKKRVQPCLSNAPDVRLKVVLKLPIESIYQLYLSIEESIGSEINARNLLLYIAPKEYNFLPLLPESHVKEFFQYFFEGGNVIGGDGSSIFVKRKEDILSKKVHKAPKGCPLYCSIKVLKVLGRDNLLGCLYRAMPGLILENGRISDFNYPVSFLEFCLFLVECSKVYYELKAEYEAMEAKPKRGPNYELDHRALYPFGATYISKESWEDYISFLQEKLTPSANC